MKEEKYTAAIEISSSKIIACVGRTTKDGHLEVVAVEQEKDVESVRYGIIQNLNDTSIKAERIIRHLERRTGVAPRQIKGLFVGLSGRSLRSIPVEVSLKLADDTEITDEILNRLREDAMKKSIDNTLDIVDAVPRIYKVGKSEIHTPRGTVGNSIEATFDLIVCRPELKRNLTRTIRDKFGVKINGFVVTALATGHLILTPEEKRLGCMLVDFGAETTSVTIYKNGCLRYFATLPFGGRNITRDITSLSVLEEAAEDIKITSGNAMPPETQSALNVSGLKISDVNNLVVARSEEIVANIIEQIEYAGLKDTDLTGGIVCIGGGARLQGFTNLLAVQSNLTVRYGTLPQYVTVDQSYLSTYDMEQVVSVMYAGSTLSDIECLEEPKRQEAVEEAPEVQPEETYVAEEPVEKEKKKPWWKRNVSERIANIFGDASDNSELID